MNELSVVDNHIVQSHEALREAGKFNLDAASRNVKANIAVAHALLAIVDILRSKS